MSSILEKKESHLKQDALVSEEIRIRNKKSWNNVTKKAPNINNNIIAPKYFGTFPYPYMNGTLHGGHAFTIIRLEFLARYKRQNGVNVLFPFGFHGTGTPIVACADKVKIELDSGVEFDSLPHNSQLHILYDMGVKKDEFYKFVEPNYWLEYFIDEAKKDLRLLGIMADFERSFVTTQVNPYYDSFIKWQFSILEKKQVLKFGKKNIIFSPQMNQPCAAHDRSIGEDADVQEHTLIKLSLTTEKYYKDIPTFLLAATLRPETMYGQTNVWVHKDSTYSLFKFNTEYFISRYETFRNLKYQYPDDDITIISENYISGYDLIGTMVTTPYVSHPIPVLHMNSVSSNKGTGIVTSVPTDSPTDYLYWKELVGKTDSLTNTLTGFISVNGDTTYAKTCIEEKCVKIGQEKKLQEVHDSVYKNEHNFGILTVGKYSGQTLENAHKKIQKDLIDENMAILYNEPSETVVSRAGDICVVAKTDQWYIDYGNEYFTAIVNQHIDTTLNMNSDIAQTLIKDASNWIQEWPCSRHVGLGTILPVDERFVIDSLSDSTIYMAYYTICHIIEKIPLNLLSNELWSHIFLSDKLPENIVNSEYVQLVEEMCNEFNYWYPLDMRISGKDLIRNHLTMALYNHAIIWDNPKMYPRSYSVNGHLLLNGKKMSKSTGNFLTLRGAVDKFGADAVRITLALAGEGMDDANFDENNAREATLLLTTERDWIKSICNNNFSGDNTDETVDDDIWDKIFRNEVNSAIVEITKEMELLNFRKSFVAIYKMLSSRDKYRSLHERGGSLGMTLKYYIECISFIEKLLAVMCPYCPFWVESIYDNITGHDMNKMWPKVSHINNRYLVLCNSFSTITTQINRKYSQRIKNAKKDDMFKLDITVYTKRDPVELVILNKYKDMQNIEEIHTEFDRLMTVAEKRDKSIIGKVSKDLIKNISQYGFEWMKWNLTEQLDEYEMIKDWIPIVLKDCKYKEVVVRKFEGDTYDFIKNGPNGYHTFSITPILDKVNNVDK